MCGSAFGCLSSFLPHFCILKKEHTVYVIFSFVVVACFWQYWGLGSGLHTLSCGAIFSGYQTDIVEEHGIYFHNANIIYKLRASQMDLQLKVRIYTHYTKPYSSCETQGDLSERWRNSQCQRSSCYYTGEGKRWWRSEDGSNAHIAHFPSYQQETSLPRGLNGCVADLACLCLLTRRVLGGQWRDFRRRRRKRSQTKRSWGRSGGGGRVWAQGSVEGHCCPWIF